MKIELTIPKDKIGFSKTTHIQKPEATMKDDEEIQRLKKLGLPIPHHLLYICGRSGSGKTSMLQKLLNDKGVNRKYRKVFHKIHFFSPSTNTLGEELKIPEEQIHDDLSQIEEITNSLDPTEYNLFIIDDLIFDLNENNFMKKLLTRYRHKGLSIWIVSQAYNALFRKARLNDPYVILYPMSKDQLLDVHLDRFGKDMDPDVFEKICREIWKSDDDRPFIMIDRDNKIHKRFTPIQYSIDI